MGTAQGDTLSCILFDLYVDPLLRDVYEQCPGIPLSEAHKLVAQLFADDFVGLAATPEGLQAIISKAHAFCRKWRLMANIQSGKSTVVVFHPSGLTAASEQEHPAVVVPAVPAVPAVPSLEAQEMAAAAGEAPAAAPAMVPAAALEGEAPAATPAMVPAAALEGEAPAATPAVVPAAALEGEAPATPLAVAHTARATAAPTATLQHHQQWVWGSQILPHDTEYKYLGIQLTESCSWDKHTQYIKEKCQKAVWALSSVIFRNRWIDTAIKRIMLLAVIRPIVEYGATVWHATKPQQSSLEAIQNQTLSRMAGSPNNINQHILRMDMGCRSFNSWADQRKLEYFYRLQNMSDDRLPKQVWQHPWLRGRRAGGQSTMWTKKVQQVAASADLTMETLEAACQAARSYTDFKKQMAKKIRTRDLKAAQTQASTQPTLARYLQLLDSSITLHPNSMQPYLSGPKTKGSSLKLQFRSSTAQVRHREVLTRRHDVTSSQCPCCQHQDETCQHVVVDCPHYAQLRRQLQRKISELIGAETLGKFLALNSAQQYAALIGDRFEWGEQSENVDEVVKVFLVDVMEARQLAIRGQSAAGQPASQAGGSAGPHGQEHV
jgi:hypothetical protein